MNCPICDEPVTGKDGAVAKRHLGALHVFHYRCENPDAFTLETLRRIIGMHLAASEHVTAEQMRQVLEILR